MEDGRDVALLIGGADGLYEEIMAQAHDRVCLASLTLALKAAHRPPASASPRAKLDVSLLQQLVVAKLCPTQQEQEAILYTKDDHEALDWAANGTGTGALLLNATKVREVKDVATAGERMPHKSTYFFPKPLTGLVMNVMEG